VIRCARVDSERTADREARVDDQTPGSRGSTTGLLEGRLWLLGVPVRAVHLCRLVVRGPELLLVVAAGPRWSPEGCCRV